jgi:hypothetical protein
MGENMQVRSLVAVGLGLAAAITISAVVVDNLARPEPSAAIGIGREAPSAGLKGDRSRAPTESARQPAGSGGEPEDKGSRADAHRPALPPDPEKPLEVPEPTRQARPTLPPSVERTPLMSGGLPESGTARGKLVTGFPRSVIPVPKGTRIQVSSLAVQGDTLQLGLDANTDRAPDELLEVYIGDFEDKGWLWTEAPAAEGSSAVRGGFGNDSVTVTVTGPVQDGGTGATHFTVFGIVRVDG